MYLYVRIYVNDYLVKQEAHYFVLLVKLIKNILKVFTNCLITTT